MRARSLARGLAAAGLGTVLGTALTSGIATPAHALDGGTIKNNGPQPLFITYDLGNPWGAEAILSAGRTSDTSRDADGFYVETGCRAVYQVTFPGNSIGPITKTTAGWVKITDVETAYVDYSC
ncbi:hypothetical protein [Nocardioides alkalitolerans]|uniref:hypothetical protein n=1 Tax=Nocardioides alkalitolerans TaxID=281714 RepID=UPI0003FCE1C0|nr:hypothetical protein [Nocardioides alkalitolerans]